MMKSLSLLIFILYPNQIVFCFISKTVTFPPPHLSIKYLKSDWDSFYGGKAHAELPACNITFTEWSILIDDTTIHLGSDHSKRLIEQLLESRASNPMAFMNATAIDKGTSDSLDVLEEYYVLKGDYEYHLNVFRRNIALRANRVLHPARNAEIFSVLINLMITANEHDFARAAVEYIGLTPATYCKFDSASKAVVVDLYSITEYCTRKILELDIERMAWVKRGCPLGEEPSTPKSRGESVQEWLYTQVHRSDLGFRTCDMILSVLRLAIRHAIDIARGSKGIYEKIVVGIFDVSPLIVEAGVPLTSDFLDRIGRALEVDIELLRSREAGSSFPVYIIRKDFVIP